MDMVVWLQGTLIVVSLGLLVFQWLRQRPLVPWAVRLLSCTVMIQAVHIIYLHATWGTVVTIERVVPITACPALWL